MEWPMGEGTDIWFLKKDKEKKGEQKTNKKTDLLGKEYKANARTKKCSLVPILDRVIHYEHTGLRHCSSLKKKQAFLTSQE